MWARWSYSQRENLVGQLTPAGAVQTMILIMSVSLVAIWLFFPPGSRARVSLQPNQNNWLDLSLPINNWRWCFLLLTINTMSQKTSRLSQLDVSVLEAQMRCGSEWPIGLVDAIAEAHRTTVENVIELQRVLRSKEPHDHKLNVYFWDYLSFTMSLSRFIFAGGIASIPLTNSLVLLLFKALGENDWLDASKLKKKLATKAMLSTPKKKNVTTKLRFHWKQNKHFNHQSHV